MFYEAPKTTKSYEMVRKMRKTWSSSDATKRKNDCIGLGKALESDFGGKYHTVPIVSSFF